MTSERENLGDRLAGENGLADPERKASRQEEVLSAVEEERAFVRRLGRVAILAWAGTLLLPAAAVFGIVSQMTLLSTDDPTASLGPMIPAVFLGSLGAISLIAAIVTTVAWLFRSRASSMSALEARLEELEEELREQKNR